MKSEIPVDQAAACARAPWEREFNPGIARFRWVIEQVIAIGHANHRLPGKFKSSWACGAVVRGHLLVTTLDRVKKCTPSGP